LSKQHEDIVMKSIMELFKGDAVKFFGIDTKIISAAPTELIQIEPLKKINDWMWLGDNQSFLHFEFESTYDKEDLARFMVSDAIFYYKEKKPVRTIVVYSADITDTETTLDTGTIKYSVEAFYMVKLNGDETYDRIKAKVDAREQLNKQDLMSIVFLPLMKNSVNKETRFAQAVALSKEIESKEEQLQIQAMIQLLAEKFIKNPEGLQKLKEMIGMGIIAEMIREDAVKERDIEIARNMIADGEPADKITKYTGLTREEVEGLRKAG